MVIKDRRGIVVWEERLVFLLDWVVWDWDWIVKIVNFVKVKILRVVVIGYFLREFIGVSVRVVFFVVRVENLREIICIRVVVCSYFCDFLGVIIRVEILRYIIIFWVVVNS